MEHCFSVEAKGFSFSAKAEVFELRLEERRKGFCGFIFLGLQGSAWLMAIVEEALKAPVKDFIKYFWEDVKTLMVWGGGNKADHYLEVVAYAEGGRKWPIWLLEGRAGWGWSRVMGELRQMPAFLEAKEWPLLSEVSFSEGKQKGGILSGRSYTAVLRSVDRDDEKTVGLKPLSVTPLDMLPSVLANGGELLRVWFKGL
jgi:hypothetical protein